jgi:hypothetical protein
MKRRKIGKTMYKSEYTETEITFDYVMEYIEDYATDNEIKEISGLIKENYNDASLIRIDSLNDEMKYELLMAAFKRYSLDELESRLGTKFQLM